MLAIVARTRTVGGAACVCCIMPWARTACRGCMDAANTKATALAPNTFQIVIISSLRVFRFDSLRDRTPAAPVLFLALRLRFYEVPFQQTPQFRGDFRLLAEPQLKLRHRLAEQHAEAVGGAQVARHCGAQQRRDQRHINKIGDGCIGGEMGRSEEQIRVAPTPRVWSE